MKIRDWHSKIRPGIKDQIEILLKSRRDEIISNCEIDNKKVVELCQYHEDYVMKFHTLLAHIDDIANQSTLLNKDRMFNKRLKELQDLIVLEFLKGD